MNEQPIRPQPNSEESTQREKAIVALMHKLEHLHANAYSCEEAFALLDEYVDLVTTDEEAAELMPLVKNHIEMCSGCNEAYAMLMRIVQSESDSSATL